MKKETKKLIMRIAVVIGVLIIPLAYSLLYLGAFWDPYDKMDAVPVAIVNEDKGAVIDGANRNLGEEVAENLIEDGTLNFKITDGKKAKDGVVGRDYYAAITIPKEFSQNIKSASSENKVTGVIEYQVNEKKNFLASQILHIAIEKIEKEVRSNVDREITLTLADKLKSVPDNLDTVSAGFDKMAQGSSKLNAGANKLNAGLLTLKTNGIKLTGGINALDGGMDKVVNGIDAITAKTNGLRDLAAGAAKIDEAIVGTADGQIGTPGAGLQKNLKAYTEGVNQATNTIETSTKLLGAVAKDPAMASLNPQTRAAIAEYLKGATSQQAQAQLAILKGTGTKLNEGVYALSQGTGQLKAGTANLGALQDGLNQLKNGVLTVKAGTGKLADAGAQLAPGVEALAAGGDSLANGAAQLNNGIVDGKKELDSNIDKTKKEVKKLDGIEEYAANPVKVKTERVSPVPNYGTAFAPYFLSLSLWVGGLILFVGIYLDIDRKFPTLSRDSERKVIRSFSYLGLALAQALVLAVVIKFALGLEVSNMAGYIGACCLVSMVFISIIQFCMVHLGDAGKLVVILLLIFQLTSCGGTFPMETVPKIFNTLYPFMPMTYSVGLFKETISGQTADNLALSVMILVGFMVIFMAATILMSVMKKGARELRKAKKAAKLKEA
ncbi:MAG: YhgE/Pip domain-containing protein [Anaerovoracaceae bacterium]